MGKPLQSSVNFTNILRVAFLYESFLRSFFVLTIGFVIFWQKDSGTKAANKTNTTFLQRT
jgi:hypothetical protein